MSHPLRSTAWLLVIGLAAMIATGCGEDKAGPIDPQVPGDGAPPSSPTGLVLSAQVGSKVTVEWTPNSEARLAGYRAYRYDPNPARQDSYVCMNPDLPLTSTHVSFTGVVGATTYICVSAVDSKGNESAWSEPFPVVLDSGTPVTVEEGPDATWHGEMDRPGGDHSDPYGPGDLPLHK